MPAAANPTLQLVSELIADAMQFVPRDRGEALTRKLLGRGEGAPPEGNKLLAMMADSVLLSADLLLSQPSMTGSTAFDRLAKSRAKTHPAQAKAIASLCRARFRLLELTGPTPAPRVTLRDVISGDQLSVIGDELPPLPPGTMLFGRVAVLDGTNFCLAGATTPLDAAAFAVARFHPSAGATSLSGGARWAEAVYTHVVRNGTMDVPHLNRPADFFDDDEPFDDDDETINLVKIWSALGSGSPSADLMQRTRQCADLPTILDALIAAADGKAAKREGIAEGLQRMLFVLLETVQRRERSGSGTMTLDSIARAIDAEIAARTMPANVRAYFQTCRQKLDAAGGAQKPDDIAMARLMQRIQALRAKTVAQGCTEHEALAAAEKIAELLDRHGLSLSELEFQAQPCEGIGIDTGRRRMGPIDQCVPTIAEFFDCRVWAEHPKGGALRYIFFGLRGDVAAAQYLYEMVERAFDTETSLFKAGKLYADMAGARRSATTSFQTGLARGICAKLDLLRTARDERTRSASGRDLVPLKAAMVDNELEKLGLALRVKTSSRPKSVLTDAFAAGHAAGERFELTQALTKPS